ncbi:MAG: DUF1015 family protein [Opitutales bacterium]|nr:DUF1015 family protein [Opitutales bacterium]
MINFKPFRAIRPSNDHVAQVASQPYDVLNSEEARLAAVNNKSSFLHVIKSEIDLPENTNPYSEEVYLRAKENFLSLIDAGVFSQDSKACFYIYRLTMNNRSQTGLVGCCHFQQYYDGLIKKHELTRTAKENDRVRHVEVLDANSEPVFFSYRGKPELNAVIQNLQSNTPVYDFVAEDGVRHELWICSDDQIIEQIGRIFSEVPCLYVADGHHRTAAAARVGTRRSEANLNHEGTEEYNYFMAVVFPDDQLEIFDYNRVVRDLNGLTPTEFITLLKSKFVLEPIEFKKCKPSKIREFAMYLDGQWYRLTPLDSSRNSNPVKDLDVTILYELVLNPILNIKDLRKSDRIDFIGGIRGLDALQVEVDSGKMAAAFALFPVSMEQLLTIADAGEIMPPKTTWFEPKLRSGLFVHSLL